MNNINFVSVPRCASNAIQKALDGTINPHHESIRKTKDDRWAFAVIRDPLDRLISWWKYHQLPQYGEAGEIYRKPFKDWVMSGCKHHWTVDNLKTAHITNPLHQFDFVCDTDGNIMVDKLIKFDDVVERGGIDLSPGVRIFIQLEHLNASNPTKHAGLSRKVIERIQTDFKNDYQLFNQL